MKKGGTKKRLKWKHLSLKTQMILCILVLSVGAVLASTAFYYRSAQNYIENNNEQYISDAALQLSKTIEEFLSQVDIVTKEIAYGNQIQDLLHHEAEYNNRDVYSNLMAMIRTVEGVDAVAVFDMEGKSYYGYQSGRINLFYDVKGEEWFKNLEEKEKSFYYLPEDNHYPMQSQDRYLCYVRRIQSVKNLKTVGVLICQINMEKIEGFLKGMSSEVAIVDGQGNLLATNAVDKELVYQKIAESYHEEQGTNYFFQSEGNHYYVTVSGIAKNDWTVISATEEKKLLDGISVFYRNNIVVMGIILVLVVTIALVYIHSIMKSMQKLMDGAEEIEKGNFDYYFMPGSNKEIQILSDKFNAMALRLKELFQNVQKQEQQKRKLELEALSYQISPHFLYNTLSSVKYMAIMQKATGIETIVDSLVFMLQKTFRKESEYITLREEMELVSAYLKIMNIRYMNQLEVSTFVDEKLLSCTCLHLIVQPIIENAVFHGSAGGNKKTKIKITVSKAGKNVQIRVWNDGPAIEKERAKMLLDDSIPMKSVGLRNTHHRLQTCFGKEYGISIVSEEEQGTEIILTFPYIIGGKE